MTEHIISDSVEKRIHEYNGPNTNADGSVSQGLAAVTVAFEGTNQPSSVSPMTLRRL